MERPQDCGLPTLNANLEKLQRELQQLYHHVKANGPDRNERTPHSPTTGVVIKGK